MRKEKQVHNLVIVSIVMVAVLIITFIGFLVSKSSRKSSEEEFAKGLSSFSDSESASTQIGKSVQESQDNEFEVAEVLENKTSDSESKTNETKPSSTNATSKTEETKKQEKSNQTEKTSKRETKKEEEPEFEAPLKGEIIKEFAKDSLVFSNTLQEWITHNAVDIKADKTSVVKAAAEGTVYAIKNDPRYGLTVIINHSGGYQTVYSNLLTAEFVVKGEKVEKGQSIGTVGNSASFEIADDFHLHFELLKDNEYVDPTIYMNF